MRRGERCTLFGSEVNYLRGGKAGDLICGECPYLRGGQHLQVIALHAVELVAGHAADRGGVHCGYLCSAQGHDGVCSQTLYLLGIEYCDIAGLQITDLRGAQVGDLTGCQDADLGGGKGLYAIARQSIELTRCER